MKISDKSYERVTSILEDICDVCETEDYYEDWEDIARASFCTYLDDLDADRYDMTCEAIREQITVLYSDGRNNYAKGVHAAFCGYLIERREYLDLNGFYDEPYEPDDTEDEDEMEEYREAMEEYAENKAYTDIVDKWINAVCKMKI